MDPRRATYVSSDSVPVVSVQRQPQHAEQHDSLSHPVDNRVEQRPCRRRLAAHARHRPIDGVQQPRHNQHDASPDQVVDRDEVRRDARQRQPAQRDRVRPHVQLDERPGDRLLVVPPHDGPQPLPVDGDGHHHATARAIEDCSTSARTVS